MTNAKLAKRSFLVSLMALILCFSMLMGTTFAWFTDSVTSENNIIKSGKLDVEMYWADELLDSTSDKWNDASKGAIFDYQYWEPGYSEVKYIKIVNAGDLAFKFQLNLIPDILPTVGKANLADVIDVYLLDPAAEVKADTPMTNKGTLASLMSATDGAAKGAILPASGSANMNLDAIKAALGVTDIPVGEIIVAIKLTMQETAGNEYQNLTVGDGFAVQLLATQVEAENDSFDNSYDQDATYPSVASTATELIDALRSGKDVTLNKNIDLKDVEWTPIASYSGVLDGNGYAIQNLTGANGLFAMISGATIKNLNLENVAITSDSSIDKGYYIGAVAGQIDKIAGAPQTVIENVTVSGTIAGGNYYTGGLVGADRSYDTLITGCVNNANVSGAQQVGGLIGQANRLTVIDGCTNNGTITATNLMAGGLVGLVAGDDNNPSLNVTVKNSTNNGTVALTSRATSNLVGGIAGAVGRDGGDAVVNEIKAYFFDNTVAAGQAIYGAAYNYSTGGSEKITVVVGSTIAEGVYEAGTRNYYVSDAAGLANVATIIPQNREQSQSINLLSDIDMSGIVWTPMSNMHLTFNGNGHTISNLNCAESWRSGLFGYAGGVVINDLTLENVTSRGAQVGTFAGSAEGLRMNNCYLKGNNTVTYVTYKTDSYEETWGGIGAITGVLASSTINAEIVAGATVTLDKGTMVTNCTYYDDLTGYLNANSGTVVNNGKVTALLTVAAADQESLNAAIAGGATTVNLAEGNYDMPQNNLRGKKLTVKGTGDTVIDASAIDARNQFVTGAELVFEDVTLNFGTVNYMGFANASSIVYKNCKINGLQFLFGPSVTFIDCDLNSNGAEHCVWTYGAQNVTFTDCDFTYGDRGINCYSDNDVVGGKQTVNFNNCTFTTENTDSDGAVEINSYFFSVGIEVNMNGCTAPAYGEMAYVSQWDSTNGAKTTINVQ